MRQLAIMQPYFFPYLGYWQLMSAADCFVIYDDVNFIKGGWISRNLLYINDHLGFINIPIVKASSNKLICEIQIYPDQNWQSRLLKTIEFAYKKTKFFDEIFPFVETLLTHETLNLSSLLNYQIQAIAKLLMISTEIISTSRQYNNSHLKGEKRVIDICKKENATTYINPAAGASMYHDFSFIENKIQLKFIQINQDNLNNRGFTCPPWPSIIDTLMHNGISGTKVMLDQYSIQSKFK